MARRQLLGWGGAVLAGAMAVLWSFVVPEKAGTTDGVQSLLIRYGHPATWAALAVLGVLVALDVAPRARTLVGAVSLACYAGFLLALTL